MLALCYGGGYIRFVFVVVGDKEAAENTVSITVRGQKQQVHGVPLETLVKMCNKMNAEHSLELIGEVPEE